MINYLPINQGIFSYITETVDLTLKYVNKIDLKTDSLMRNLPISLDQYFHVRNGSSSVYTDLHNKQEQIINLWVL